MINRVKMSINFNAVEVLTVGEVIADCNNHWLVDFTHDGVTFRGLWPKQYCQGE